MQSLQGFQGVSCWLDVSAVVVNIQGEQAGQCNVCSRGEGVDLHHVDERLRTNAGNARAFRVHRHNLQAVQASRRLPEDPMPCEMQAARLKDCCTGTKGATAFTLIMKASCTFCTTTIWSCACIMPDLAHIATASVSNVSPAYPIPSLTCR